MTSPDALPKFILSPETAKSRLIDSGIPEEVWEHHIATGGLTHWSRVFMYIAKGSDEIDAMELFKELHKDDPLLDRRLDEMTSYLEDHPEEYARYSIEQDSTE